MASLSANGRWTIPDDPIVCLMRGDGIGRDVGGAPGITTCAARVLDAAVEKAYKGKRRIHWFDAGGLRTYAAEGATANGNTYALERLNGTYQELYYRIYFNCRSQSTGFTLLADQTASGMGIVRLYLNPQGQLVLWNDVTNLTITGPAVSPGTWHSVELHVIVNGTSGTTAVWLDGSPVPAMSSQSAVLGTTPVGQIQLGSQANGAVYDMVFDDVVVSTARIGR